MKKNQVAIIDIGSSEIRAVIAERGINKTFVLKEEYSLAYDGFENLKFYSEESVKEILTNLCQKLVKAIGGGARTVFVGVPSAFTEVFVKEGRIAFTKRKKICEEDVDSLFDAAFMQNFSTKKLINRSAVVYELGDARRVANPIGLSSEILKGTLSFIVCDNYFIEIVSSSLIKSGFKNVEFASVSLAESLYLIEANVRDRVSLLVDVGYITSTLSVVQGDGIIFEKSFEFGGGYITANLLEKFNLDFEVAEKLKRKVNLCSLSKNGVYDMTDVAGGSYYDAEEVKRSILQSLDAFCEQIALVIENMGFYLPEYVPLSITGGGIVYIRGAKEHISKRLNMAVEVLSPKVPLMDKPTNSSILSLLDLVLEQNS